jgi:CRP-like cAMP-binding protein
MFASLVPADAAVPRAPTGAPVAEPERVARLLGTLSLLDGALPAEPRAAFAEASVLSCPAGTVLFDAGQPADVLYVVVAGRVRLLPGGGPDGRVLAVSGRGDTIGLAALLRGDLYPVSAVVSDDAVLVRLPSRCVRRLIDEHPATAARLVGDMGAQLARFVRDIGGFTQHGARTRVARLLLDLHRDAAGDADGPADGVAFVEPKRAIAQRLAMTPETLSRELQTLSRQGLIESRRTRFRVLDVAGLERAIGGAGPARAARAPARARR